MEKVGAMAGDLPFQFGNDADDLPALLSDCC